MGHQEVVVVIGVVTVISKLSLAIAAVIVVVIEIVLVIVIDSSFLVTCPDTKHAEAGMKDFALGGYTTCLKSLLMVSCR